MECTSVWCTFRKSEPPIAMATGARLVVRDADVRPLSSRRRGSAGPLSVVEVVRDGYFDRYSRGTGTCVLYERYYTITSDACNTYY